MWTRPIQLISANSTTSFLLAWWYELCRIADGTTLTVTSTSNGGPLPMAFSGHTIIRELPWHRHGADCASIQTALAIYLMSDPDAIFSLVVETAYAPNRQWVDSSHMPHTRK